MHIEKLSCVMKTKEGAVIVVDGGRDVDAPHLIEVIQELGGHVDVWLLTHPHSDHVGAITEILNMDPMPISIGKVYYSFLNKEFLGQEQVSRRDSDLECYDQITEAIAKLPEAEKCGTLTKGQKISVAGAEITVMNEPFACTENSFNNSSVAYRVEMGGKRIKDQLNLDIDKKKLVLPEPIKTFGTHEVPIKLHKEVTGKLAVKVVEA